MITPARAAFAGIFVVTLLGLLSVGAVLPVLPRYVKGPIGAGDISVGIVIGAFAFTGIGARPFAGRLADRRGRRPTVVAGALISALAGALLFVPAGVPGLIVARLVLGIGEGAVFTAGSAWIIDLAPPHRRARIIGLYGLSIWTGLSVGPAIGELLLQISTYELVWGFAALAPLLGAVVALRIPDTFVPLPRESLGRQALLAREALGPGAALALASAGFAALAAFIVLHLDARGIGHGAVVFMAFAATVVVTRLLAGGLPDRIGSVPCSIGAAAFEAIGLALIALAHSLEMAIAGALVMGAAFSILYPSLSLIVVERVHESRRGAALGTFTASFDLGVGIGAPVAGAAAALGGYEAAFWVAASAALLPALALSVRWRQMREEGVR